MGFEKHKLLTREEEIELGRRIKAGDIEARQTLTVSNLALVKSIAKHYTRHGLSPEDIVQEGDIGLIRAAETFDPELDIRFSTYATHCIRNAIHRAIEEKSRLIRIPGSAQKKIRLLEKREQEYLNSGLETEPSTSGTLDEFSMELERIRKRKVVSLDSPIDTDSENPRYKFIATTGDLTVDQVVKNSEAAELNDLMESVLDYRALRIIEKRFTLGMTLEDIGKQEGISRQRVLQVVQESLEKLRDPSSFEIQNRRRTRLSISERRKIILAYASEPFAQRASKSLGHGACTILKYWRDMGFSIDTSSRPLDESARQAIVGSHGQYNGNASEAARHLPYSCDTVLKYWELVGLPTKRSHFKLSDEDIDRIEAAYTEFNGSLSEASRHLPFKPGKISSVWRALVPEYKSKSLKKEDVDIIISGYAEYGGNILEASRNLGYKWLVIRGCWNNAGFQIRKSGQRENRSLKKDDVDAIVSSYTKYNGKILRASRNTGHSQKTIRKYWVGAGLEILESGRY